MSIKCPTCGSMNRDNARFCRNDGEPLVIIVKRAGGDLIELHRTEEEVKQYVIDELAKALPEGWIANLRLQYRHQGKHAKQVTISDLEWKICRQQKGMDLEPDYLLSVSGDLRMFVVLHGNTDAGHFSLTHVLYNATVIYINNLYTYSLSELISEIIRTCEPNRWGVS